MSKEEKIESSPRDGKTGSRPDLPAGPEGVNDEFQSVNRETSIVNEEAIHHTSDITTSDIPNMEVHHHPHVEKKRFKEYFLEFLMIFLAVTLGFFAENIREHFAEKKT